MKNFDVARAERANRDRGFKIGGEEFLRKTGVRPEIMIAWEALGTNQDSEAVLNAVDEIVVGFLDPTNDAEARYRKIREREEDPVTLADLVELVQWLVEEETGRPTQQPSASTSGDGGTSTTSTDVSSSRVAKRGPGGSPSVDS